MARALTDSWTLGGVRIPNRVVLAPLAGIGNWFVRLQARRFGAGLVVSEMVSSFAVHHRNERTCREMLRIHPDEHPVSVQLFGHDPDVMASAAERVAAAGADLIDLNMGCPVPKVCKTGAGAALLEDPARAVALARAAARGSGLPVTVKLRSGQRPGDRAGVEVARRLVSDAGVAGICIHPRHASQRHRGSPDHRVARELVQELPVPVLVSGGLHTAPDVREAFERTGAAGVLVARGSLGNPWLFEQLLGLRGSEPSRAEVLAELDWVIDRAVEHLGAERASRYLRKFYPWYVDRLGGGRALQAALQSAPTIEAARELLWGAAALAGRPAPRAVYTHLPTQTGCVPIPLPGGFFSRPERTHTGLHVMPKDVILTPEGLANLKAELEHLTTTRRREVAERIKEAREFGDISENAEYDDAKNEQAMLEARIAQLEDKLRSATVIDSSDLGTDVVRVGSTVHVKDEEGKSTKYTIVGSAEASPAEMKLSNESPVGKALLGRKRGEEVTFSTPKGERKLKITKIDVATK